jgi:hypothetical protein
MSIPACSAQLHSLDQSLGRVRYAEDCSIECEHANIAWSIRESYTSANHAYAGNRGCSAVHDVDLAVTTELAADILLLPRCDEKGLFPASKRIEGMFKLLFTKCLTSPSRSLGATLAGGKTQPITIG